MTVHEGHLHREDCHCTECCIERAEIARERAYINAERHRPLAVLWDDDRTD